MTLAHTIDAAFEEVWTGIVARMPPLALLQKSCNLRSAVRKRVAQGVTTGVKDSEELRLLVEAAYPVLSGERRKYSHR